MAYRKILHEGEETLRKISKPVVDFDQNLFQHYQACFLQAICTYRNSSLPAYHRLFDEPATNGQPTRVLYQTRSCSG